MAFGDLKEAVLVLEDGKSFIGYSAGAEGTTTGEICFNTGMTGYQEIFTDPSYYGQIMVMTAAHIGNYGASQSDEESDSIKIAGLVCNEFSDHYSREVADESLDDYFKEQNLVGIYGIDTRSLVRHIREQGAMNAIISSEELDVDKLKKSLKDVPSMDGLELASRVTTTEPYYYGNEMSTYRLAVIDFGVKKNMLDCFVDRDCYLAVFPATTSYEEMAKWNPDGFFLSNGPGDPAPMDYAIETVKKIIDNEFPVFGICLGHQLMALSQGIPTYKMHHGHRGINHPVLNVNTKRGEITSQNHGFGVSAEKIKENNDRIEITHVNLNDDTIEGIRVKGKKAFSIQYHPESSPGPHDSRYLFDTFLETL